ncbi:unnamed protein product, partial [Scytosiphon promiscuus]
MTAKATSTTAAAATAVEPATVKGEVHACSNATLGKGLSAAVQVETTASGAAAPGTATDQGADTSGTAGALIDDATLQIGGLEDSMKCQKPSPIFGSDISTDGGSGSGGSGGGGDTDGDAAVEPDGALLASPEKAEAAQSSLGAPAEAGGGVNTLIRMVKS